MVAMGLLQPFRFPVFHGSTLCFMESPVSSDPLGSKHFYGIEAPSLAQEFHACTSILDLLVTCYLQRSLY